MIPICRHKPEHFKHGESHFYRCTTCGEQLFSKTTVTTGGYRPVEVATTTTTTTNGAEHPSMTCNHCGHWYTQHDGGCQASVREGLDGVKRCECLENYGEPS